MNLVLISLMSISLAFTAPKVARANALLLSCGDILGQLRPQSSSPTESYINLIRDLVQNKNLLSDRDMKVLLSQSKPVNPLNVMASSLAPEPRYAYGTAFTQVLNDPQKRPLDWNKIRREIEKLLDSKKDEKEGRGRAKEDTREILNPRRVDVVLPSELTTRNRSSRVTKPILYGDDSITYLNANTDLVILNLKTKKEKIINLNSDTLHQLYSIQIKGETFFIVREEGTIRIFDQKGNTRTRDFFRSEDIDLYFDKLNLAFAKQGNRQILVRTGIERPDPQGPLRNGILHFFRFGGLKTAPISVTLGEKLQGAWDSMSPTAYNFKNGSIVGVIGEKGGIYFFDPFHGKLLSKVSQDKARGKVHFYEANGKPRAIVFLPYENEGEAVIYNPFTGKEIKRLKLTMTSAPDYISFWGEGRNRYGLLQGGRTDWRPDVGYILDLGSDKLLEHKVILSEEQWPDEKKSISNIETINFGGRDYLLWGNDAGELVVYDPLSNVEVSRTKLVNGRAIEFVTPFRTESHWGAFLAIYGDTPIIIDLTMKSK